MFFGPTKSKTTAQAAATTTRPPSATNSHLLQRLLRELGRVARVVVVAAVGRLSLVVVGALLGAPTHPRPPRPLLPPTPTDFAMSDPVGVGGEGGRRACSVVVVAWYRRLRL
ncbi:hypothetical protein E2C01_073671 [Portunus trituberculatus]|uniref:Uncharacterized protein n=1 Tax=Portunus trituberculatus TaxID=210409 RepID=A0A5B7IE55_PORTR|nr:hypothetical protein [Portunus trituberculatus]